MARSGHPERRRQLFLVFSKYRSASALPAFPQLRALRLLLFFSLSFLTVEKKNERFPCFLFCLCLLLRKSVSTPYGYSRLMLFLSPLFFFLSFSFSSPSLSFGLITAAPDVVRNILDGYALESKAKILPCLET